MKSSGPWAPYPFFPDLVPFFAGGAGGGAGGGSSGFTASFIVPSFSEALKYSRKSAAETGSNSPVRKSRI